MQKSNFQLLAEELTNEINQLDREIRIRRHLLEAAPGPTPVPDGGKVPPYPANPNVVPTNAGFIAGTYGVNADTIVQNPNVLAGVKGRITLDADPRVIKFKPYTSNNLATMMGLGIDDASFGRAKEFIKQYGDPNDVDGVAETDDPEESKALSWKKLNHAVSRFTTMKVKDQLNRNHLFRGPNGSNYEQALPDTYNLYSLGKKAQRVVKDTVDAINGKAPKSSQKGKQVQNYISRITGPQSDRMSAMWSQNADQSNRIKFGKK